VRHHAARACATTRRRSAARTCTKPRHHAPPRHQANGLGWYPQFNHVWEFFGMPGYSW
jgi:hypothetical protein